MTPAWCADTEGFLIQPGQAAPKPVTLAWSWDGKTAEAAHLNEGIERRGWEQFHSRLYSKDRLGFHNGPYDLASLCAEKPEFFLAVWDAYRAERIVDTLDRQKLIDIAQGIDDESGWVTVLGVRRRVAYDLASVTERHSTILLDKEDPWRLRYGTLWDVPISNFPPEALHYMLRDPIGTAVSYYGQEECPALLVDQFRQGRASWWIHLMGAWGVRTDRSRIIQAERETLEDIARDKGNLQAWGLVRKDGSKDTKLARQIMLGACQRLGQEPHLTDKGLEVFQDRFGIRPEKGTPEQIWNLVNTTPEYIALDEDAIAAVGSDQLDAYQRYGSSSTLLRKIRRLYKGSGSTPIQSSFVALKATGRTSCRQEEKETKKDKTPSLWGSQLQNPPTTSECAVCTGAPKEFACPRCRGTKSQVSIRECFVPRPGFVFGGSDYSGVELCTWGQTCIWALGKSKMAEVLNAGQDPHTQFAVHPSIMQVPSTVSDPYTFGLECKKGLHGPEWEKKFYLARQSGKIANFGWPGGMGPGTLQIQARTQYGVHLALDECKKLREVWKQLWPEAVDYFKWINFLTSRGGGKATIEHFLSGRIRGDIPYTVTANGFFQGLAADLGKDSGFEISREMYTVPESPLFGSRLWNFVHDEFLAEHPEYKAHYALTRMDQIMREVGQKWIPDVKLKTEPALFRRWYKEAGTKRDKRGHLIIWEREAV